ncbi:MAG: hypothetical protein OEZ01_03510 [Candidatus Heimdallarchaeota archaeon]|nr:hypothetical protein [Candidatus Heimdallarchaeota archaeon]
MPVLEKWSPLLFVCILLLAILIFWPALSGPFLLDDFIHFPRLAETGTIDTAREVYQLMFGGGGATGRPLSFLSLLINDNAWPSSPWGFKYTNLMIHLLNGVLVFVFFRQLASLLDRTGNKKYTNITALAAMTIWLLHPIQLSPMMLTIQRMTLLMALFTLLGLITYTKGRTIVVTNTIKGYLIMSIGVAGFGILGALCKEPAIMMVCYIFAIEATIFSKIQLTKPPAFKYWMLTFIYMPFISIWAYFLHDLGYMNELYVKREFNMSERLMTEARVLTDYLRIIFLPSISASGPFHDDYLISRGLLQPVSTLISIITILLSIIFAFLKKTQYPLISFSILWFFLAHTLESTILPIELYFEHRNYLPMIGFIFAFSYWAINSVGKIKGVFQMAILIFIILESGVSYTSAQVWGNRALIATIWSYEHPGSLRAQLGAIRFWLDLGEREKVAQHFNIALANRPDDAGIYMYRYLVNACGLNDKLQLDMDLDNLRKIAPSSNFEHASIESIKYLIDKMKENKCISEYKDVLEIIDLYLSNEKFYNISQIRGLLYQQKSRVYLMMRDLDNTIKMLDFTYKAIPRYSFALNQAYLLTTAGLHKDALEYIKIAKNTKPHNLSARTWKNKDIEELENAILDDMSRHDDKEHK